MALEKYDSVTRWLHYAVASAVTLQLLLSLFMRAPKPERILTTLQQLTFSTHKWAGIFAACFIFLHWLWSLSSKQRLSHLFPWGRLGREAIVNDFLGLIKLKLPVAGPRGGLPGFVHGLGFLAVSAMSISGSILFYYYPNHLPLSDSIHFVKAIHEFFATLVWIYFCGHVGLAILHRFTR